MRLATSSLFQSMDVLVPGGSGARTLLWAASGRLALGVAVPALAGVDDGVVVPVALVDAAADVAAPAGSAAAVAGVVVQGTRVGEGTARHAGES